MNRLVQNLSCTIFGVKLCTICGVFLKERKASCRNESASIVDQHWGRLDVLVNNAGISIRHPTMKLSFADWNNVVAVNMTGVFLGCRAAARHMLRQGAGSIVNTASIMGLSGGGLYPNVSYQTTKICSPLTRISHAF
jgi:NAD(P)-dependent dehydrogenase (short-subunit alcohol dehydrogenase family)